MHKFTSSSSSSAASGVGTIGPMFILTYGLAGLGFYIAVMTPVAMTLALRVSALDPVGKGGSLGTVLGLGALCAMLANPLFGQLSDRTRSRFGRRKPWIVFGIVLGTAAQFMIAESQSILVLGFAWCLVQISYNALLAALVAVIPDQVPEQQRALVSALFGMSVYIALLVGSLIIHLIGTEGQQIFLLPAGIGFLSVLVFLLVFKDPSSLHIKSPEISLVKSVSRIFWVNPKRYPDFGFAWLSRFLVFFGFAVLTSYQIYYLTDHMGIKNDAIGNIMFISTSITAVCVIVAAMVSGWLSDRSGRRKIFVFTAASTYAGGILLIVLANDLGLFFGGVGVAALGFGVYMAVDQALVIDVLPEKETNAAKNLGVLNIANAVPQSLAPAIAPFLLGINNGGGQNYVLLYFVAALVAFGGALAIIPVRGVR